MGHQRWVLANGLQGGRGVELCLRPPPAGGTARLAGDSYLVTHGIGRVASILLRDHRDGTGYCNNLC